MKEKIRQLKEKFNNQAAQALSKDDIEKLRIEYLGRKGIMRGLLAAIAALQPEEKPQAGVLINEFKNEIAKALDEKSSSFAPSGAAGPELPGFDITMPGIAPAVGH